MSFQATPSQTVGPFFSIGCDRMKKSDLGGEGVAGERIEVTGRVIDGDGAGVPDAMLEIWQANSSGKYARPEDTQDIAIEERFQGFGRIPTDANGAFRFATIKPGAWARREAPGPAHCCLRLHARIVAAPCDTHLLSGPGRKRRRLRVKSR
jgi:protocatechuate 3,4-dioxygenase, alpha subunit